MPVHRVPGGKAGGVFAYAHELDAWLTQAQTPAAATEPSPVPSRWNRPPRTVAMGLGAGAVVLTLAVSAWFLLRPPAAPVEAVLTDHAIVANDADGNTLWSWPAGHRIARYSSTRLPRATRAAARAVVADLDGDGRAEVLAVIGRESEGLPIPSQELVCLSSDGQVRWRYRPDDTRRFDKTTYGPPWLFSDVVVTGPPGQRTIWVALIHAVMWPSLVVRLDPAGRPGVALVNSGSIYALSALPDGAAGDVLAAGVNNAYRSAMATALTRDAPPVTSPPTTDRAFICEDCQGDGASPYVLLPPSEYTSGDPGMLPYNFVHDMLEDEGLIRIQTVESEHWNILAFYRLDPRSLTVVDTSVSDSASKAHLELERAGRVTHTWDVCPRRREVEVRRFEGAAGWQTLAVPAR